MSAEPGIEPLEDQVLVDLIDEADELHRLYKKAEAKFKPIATKIKGEMLRRGVDFLQTPAGTPAKIVRIEKDSPQLEIMRTLLPEELYNQVVKHGIQINLNIGKRQA